MKTWSELQSWRPDLETVQKISLEIFEAFATSESAEKAKKGGDDWLAHCIYFIRDALVFCEFEHAVSHADAGRVIRVFKFWALAFRGSGQHNYARECVEVLVKWKYELPPSLRLALEKSWFVNRWGEPSRWIASDLYLEQLNFWVKVSMQDLIGEGLTNTMVYSASSLHREMESQSNTSCRKDQLVSKLSATYPIQLLTSLETQIEHVGTRN